MQQRETELQRPRTQLGLQKVTNAIQSGSPILYIDQLDRDFAETQIDAPKRQQGKPAGGVD